MMVHTYHEESKAKDRRPITMIECSIPTQRHFTACASLAALGLHVRYLDVFGPIREMVSVEQKTVKHAPSDKLYDAFISLLAGAHGLVEINTRLRSDPVLQAAFGRAACAEQSLVQQTLDACTATTVKQMEQAMDAIYCRHSQGYRHDYRAGLQLLDVDMSGLPCGPKAAFATKGYFAKQRNRRGRQLGRVLASHYDEIVVDRLFDGKTQLTRALQPLMQATERTLKLDKAKRVRTIVRVDSGGGSLDDVNWLLSRGYQLHAKDYSGRQARNLAKSVLVWFDDPHVPERQAGWVTEDPKTYVRPVRRIAVRCRKQDGQWAVGVLISTLTEAQQMLMLLGTLAHNTIVWARHWLAAPQLRHYGMLRMVRDVFHISGFLAVDAQRHIVQIGLNQAAPLAPILADSLRELLAPLHLAIHLNTGSLPSESMVANLYKN